MHIMASMQIWVSTMLVGALFTPFFDWNVIQSARSSWKQSIVIQHDKVTHPLLIDNC